MDKKKVIIVFGFIAIVLIAMYFTGKSKKNTLKNNNTVENSSIRESGVSSSNGNSEEISKNISGNCEEEYNKVFETNKFDFSKMCKSIDVRNGKYNDKEVKKIKRNLVLIFDSSGSMNGKISGETKISLAKKATNEFLKNIGSDEDLSLSVVVYGHKGSNSQKDRKMSCEGIEEIYTLENRNNSEVSDKINSLSAKGWTPLADSFKKAKEILKGKEGDDNLVLLVSDGKEMCDGDPIAEIKKLKNSSLNIKTDVIGFSVNGSDAEQLRKISELGGGTYSDAKNIDDLKNSFALYVNNLNKIDYKIKRGVNQLYDVSFIINNYAQCNNMLEKERGAMMLDIYGSKLVSEKCADGANDKYDSRYQKLKKEFEDVYKKDMENFNKTFE